MRTLCQPEGAHLKPRNTMAQRPDAASIENRLLGSLQLNGNLRASALMAIRQRRSAIDETPDRYGNTIGRPAGRQDAGQVGSERGNANAYDNPFDADMTGLRGFRSLWDFWEAKRGR
jgi:hypothetical protein